MKEGNNDSLAQYYAMKRARKAALSLVINQQMPSPCDLDGMVIPHPFRSGELVRFDTLMAQIEATSKLVESGPGLAEETRYLALLELSCSRMHEDDAALFRHACGIDGESASTVLRAASGLSVKFIPTDHIQVA